jgi:hypothetical protein
MYRYGVIPNANPIRLARPYLPVEREEYSITPTVATMKHGGVVCSECANKNECCIPSGYKLPVVTLLKNLKV